MSALAIDFDQDVADTIEDLSGTLTVSDAEITVTYSDVDRSTSVDADDGEFSEVDVRVVARVSSFSSLSVDVPELEDVVNLKRIGEDSGLAYYIETRTDSPDGVIVEFGLKRV